MAKIKNNKPQVRKSNVPVTKKEDKGEKVFTYKPNMTVAEIAKSLNISNAVMIKKIMSLGLLTSINQVLDRDTVEILVLDFGYEIKDEVITDVLRYDEFVIEDDPKDLVNRPPIVTVMGHVDHGKTTLLDAIRKSRVVHGEAGGITQHIGAYQVKRGKNLITFIDTPGHAAFTEMRLRGAKTTDIVILVVAADDGVMPQTIEALDHAKAAKVPIIVAVNKIDKPTANPENVMNELSNYGLLPETWGGDVPYVMVSALKKQGLDELLDVIELISEIEDFKANPNRLASGVVIEASLDKNRGPVATLMVQSGTLKIGDNFVCGTTYGKVRSMHDDLGKRQQEAFPSQPIEVTGLSEVPEAGDTFMVFDDERMVRQIAAERSDKQKLDLISSKKISLDQMLSNQEQSEKDLNILIKCDVHGSLDALRNVLGQINVEDLRVNIIRAGVGAITENDVILASASQAIIIGFNVRPTANVRTIADDEGIEIRLYNVIYRVQEDIEAALKGMLEPVFEEVVIGQAEVRDIFKASKIGTIAGSYVTDGIVRRDSLINLIRDGILIYSGRLASLKRFKDDVREVKQGFECGISIENYNDIKVGDIIEFLQMKEVED